MPFLNILTNVPVDKVDASEIIKELSSYLAGALGKPESYICIALRTDVSMSFGGTEDPCAFIDLKSIGLPVAKHKQLSADIASFMETKLGIPKNRFYIDFKDQQRPNVGYNGSTFG